MCLSGLLQTILVLFFEVIRGKHLPLYCSEQKLALLVQKKTFIIPFSAEFALRFLVPCMHATAHAITHLTVFKNQMTYMSIDPNYYEVRRHKISFYITEG